MLPAHEEILSIQLVTNNKYARQVRSCAAGFNLNFTRPHAITNYRGDANVRCMGKYQDFGHLTRYN
jgi:hypothetical protein